MATTTLLVSLLLLIVASQVESTPDLVHRLLERSRRQADQEQTSITSQKDQQDAGQLDQRLGTGQASPQYYQPCVYQQPIKYYNPCPVYCPQYYYYPSSSNSWSSSSSSSSGSNSWSESSSGSNSGTGNVWPSATEAPSLNIPGGLCKRSGGVGC